MAGIGFELKKLFNEESYIGDIKAYIFAGMVSSGPWIISIASLGLLWMFSSSYIGAEFQKLFRATVVYTFAYSLITTGAIQLVVTRFLSDRLFLRQRNVFLPTYVGLILLTVIIQGITASIFYYFTEFDMYYKILGVVLYVAVSCIWQTMIFLSAARDYTSIVSAFFWGCLVSVGGAVLLGKNYGFDGHILGFTIGQALIVMVLMYRIFCEFDSTIECNFEFLTKLDSYFDLLLVGAFYYCAIWADKVIYWYAKGGERVGTLFYSHYPYDSCMFLAFLTIIPALANFLIDVETSFYEKYRSFYGSIVNKGALSEIKKKKGEMIKVIRDASSRTVLLQIMVTGTFIFSAPYIIHLLSLQSKHLPLIGTAAVGTFFHVFLLIALIFILYFDRKKSALLVCFFFFVTNVLFTLLVIKYAPDYMGAGYAAATFTSFIFAFIILFRSLRNIEYLTFTEQPLVNPKLPSESVEGIEGEGKAK